jgi:lipopolysaccharide export system permease protein
MTTAMFTLLSKYFNKRFLNHLFIAAVTWVIIFLVVDIIENLSKFLDRGATLEQTAYYYLYYIPYIISLTLPVAVLLATLFSLSGFAQTNEIVAQLSSGVSLYRILSPIFFSAFLISIIAGFFNEIVVPYSNQQRLNIKRYEINKNKRPDQKTRSNLYRYDDQQKKISIRYYNGRSNEARTVSVKTFKGAQLIERIDAQKLQWKADSVWEAKNGVVRLFTAGNERIYHFKDSILTNLNIKPEYLIELQKKPEEMSYWELKKYIGELQQIGGDARKWIVDLNLKIAMPFANFIVVLLGAPLASRKKRGGAGFNFGISLMISFIYFILIRTGQVLGHQGTLTPILAAWLGNLVFISIGLYTLLSVRK